MNKKKVKPTPAPGQDDARLRQQAIGMRLRHMFDEIVNEPVPEHFLDILRQADSRVETATRDADAPDRGDT